MNKNIDYKNSAYVNNGRRDSESLPRTDSCDKFVTARAKRRALKRALTKRPGLK